MAFKVIVSEAFEDDMREALSYLVERSGSALAAKNLMRAIDSAKEELAANPFMYAVSRKPQFATYQYRERYVQKRVIIYRVEENAVLFLRLFHQAQRYERFVVKWN